MYFLIHASQQPSTITTNTSTGQQAKYSAQQQQDDATAEQKHKKVQKVTAYKRQKVLQSGQHIEIQRQKQREYMKQYRLKQT
jgi:hypothetical protein